jgi:hypothetical protein
MERGPVRLIRDPAISSDIVLRIEASAGRFVVDLSDHADLWDETGLAWCDVYLKRNVRQLRPKVRPYGLNMNARGLWSGVRAALARKDMHRAVRLFRTPHWRQFEYAPDQPTEDVVLLQTRLWLPEECGNDDAVNAGRIELVNALRNHFGPRFRGGLIGTPLARKLAPSLISAGSPRQSQYIRWQRSCKVGVYVPGLFGSLAFKLGEYLAAAKAVVSPPLENLLPEPLVDGRHLITFHQTDECIAACERMLSSDGDDFRRAAWDYYTSHVRLAKNAVDQIVGAAT